MTSATWLGHATVAIETGGVRLLTDPVLGNLLGFVRRRVGPMGRPVEPPDAILISHLHQDHFDLGSLAVLPHDGVIVVPRGGGKLARSSGFGDVRELDVGERTIVRGVSIDAVAARHDGRRLPFGPDAPALGYVIHGEHRTYFAGDTDLFAGMVALAPGLDLAILPVGGWGPTLRGGHMDPVTAARSLTLLRPSHAIAVHWGTLWPLGLARIRRDRFEEPGRRFVEAAARLAPEVETQLLDPGGTLTLPPRPPR